jgi:predicted MFS family arabinose efflux permease
LSIGQLAAVAFLAGVLTLLFGVAHSSFLPSLVREEQLIEGNSKLETSLSMAGIAGPGLGGALVQLLTAPTAILLDAVSFLLSALCLSFIRAPETVPACPVQQRSLRHDIAAGLRFVFGNSILRPLALSSATFNLFDNALFAVYILYMTRTLHLPAGAVGLVFGIAGVGGLLGAAAAAPITRWLGVGRVVVGGVALAGIAELGIAAVVGPLLLAVGLLILAEGSVQFGAALYVINSRTLRQTLTPDRMLGRVSATSDFLTQGVGPLGALLGGVLGEVIGLRGTVIVAGIGTLFAFIWVLAPPLRSLGDSHPDSYLA